MSHRRDEFLVTADALAARLGAPDLRVFDCTVYLRPDPPRYRVESGRDTYREGHVPGAGFLDLTADLSDAGQRLAFTLPDDAALERAFRRHGIDDESRIVLYAKGHMMWATRVWWMLHAAGHAHVAVLDGGWSAWVANGHPTEQGEPAPYPAGTMTVRSKREHWASRDEVASAIGKGGVCTINALSPGVYAGTSAMSYGRKGHIPGSLNVHYEQILDGDRFRSDAEIEAAFAAAGAAPRQRVIAYCGGGISATIDAFALKLIGASDVAVYDGSMSEWAADPSLPLKEGAAP